MLSCHDVDIRGGDEGIVNSKTDQEDRFTWFD